jgi:hypothetical protein
VRARGLSVTAAPCDDLAPQHNRDVSRRTT